MNFSYLEILEFTMNVGISQNRFSANQIPSFVFPSRVAQYQFFLINSISIILFPFLSIPISISINLKRAYQYQYVINYWKIPLSISISISINLLPYQYRYQYFSTCLKSSYYKSPAVQIVRQRSGPQSKGQAVSQLL